jgi:hypothetical protein
MDHLALQKVAVAPQGYSAGFDAEYARYVGGQRATRSLAADGVAEFARMASWAAWHDLFFAEERGPMTRHR